MLGIYGGDAMSVCRLSIQCDRDGQPAMVDVALPADTPVGALLPAIVELTEQPSSEWPRGWRLDRITGSPLDESITLADNGVHDGELLVLAAFHAAPLGLVRWDACRTVAAAGASGDPAPATATVARVWAAVVGSLALCSGVTGHPSIHLLTAAIGTCAAAALAAAGRSVATGVASVSLAAATGFLAVPSGPAAPNVFLAAAAAASMSLLMLRWTGHSSSTLVATACFSALVAVAVIIAVVGVVPVATVGAILAATALGLLAISGRISILLSGLATDRQVDEADERVIRGHAVLTGLVAGCSGGSALGTVLVAVGCHRYDAPSLAGVGFGAVTALVLLLRVRTHVDATRRWALAAGGISSATAAFALFVATSPEHAGWVSAMLVAVGLGAVRRPRLNAAALRAVEVLEYAALVAVVPLACWVSGVYSLVRGTHLP